MMFCLQLSELSSVRERGRQCLTPRSSLDDPTLTPGRQAASLRAPIVPGLRMHSLTLTVQVLDMCAAPGSKTAQLLEALHASTDDPNSSTNIPTGLLIANDSDYKRTHLLVHQSLRRIPSPAMMVTNLDAALFPTLKIPASLEKAAAAGPAEAAAATSKKMAPLTFDRILADVPCTGDGTMRKNVGIWRDWSVGNGQGLHPCVNPSLLYQALLIWPRLQRPSPHRQSSSGLAPTRRAARLLDLLPQPH